MDGFNPQDQVTAFCFSRGHPPWEAMKSVAAFLWSMRHGRGEEQRSLHAWKLARNTRHQLKQPDESCAMGPQLARGAEELAECMEKRSED